MNGLNPVYFVRTRTCWKQAAACDWQAAACDWQAPATSGCLRLASGCLRLASLSNKRLPATGKPQQQAAPCDWQAPATSASVLCALTLTEAKAFYLKKYQAKILLSHNEAPHEN